MQANKQSTYIRNKLTRIKKTEYIRKENIHADETKRNMHTKTVHTKKISMHTKNEKITCIRKHK